MSHICFQLMCIYFDFCRVHYLEFDRRRQTDATMYGIQFAKDADVICYEDFMTTTKKQTETDRI